MPFEQFPVPKQEKVVPQQKQELHESTSHPGTSLRDAYRRMMKKLDDLKDVLSRGARTVGVASALTLGTLHGSGQAMEPTSKPRVGTSQEAGALVDNLTEDEAAILLFYLEHRPMGIRADSAKAQRQAADAGEKQLDENISLIFKKHPRLQQAVSSLEPYFESFGGDEDDHISNGFLFRNNIRRIKQGPSALKKPSEQFKLALSMNEEVRAELNDTLPVHSESYQGSQLENTRAARIRELKKTIQNEKNLLRVHGNRALFETYYKEHVISETEKYLQTLPEQNAKVASAIDGLTEDEVSILFMEINREANTSSHTAEDENFDANMNLLLRKHPRIEKALKKLETYLSFDGDEFRNNLEKIRKTPETLKKPSEVFRRAVHMVEEGHAAFAHAWDADAITPEKINEAWAAVPPLEELQRSFQNDTEELSLIESNLNLDSLKTIIDSSRAQVIAYISDPRYLKKLIEAEGMSKEEAEVMQRIRVEAVQRVQYFLDPRYEQGSSTNDDGTFINFSAYDIAHYPKENAPHEFLHVALGGVNNMTEWERQIYEAARLTPEEIAALVKDKTLPREELQSNNPFDPKGDVFMRPGELVPRKYILETELERLGVKKRFDPMTHEQYLKAVELMKAGKLKHNAAQIIMSTSEEGLLAIMNDIAFENDKKKSEVGSA